MNPTPEEELPETVVLVPLRELTDLARLGLRMRRAQKNFFQRRKEQPHIPANTELRLARDAEDAFDQAARDALNREQGTLPGMG
ncbi:unnamed protein product [Gemmata massiliana]|uniref:Uncharacterized protein n=1 Tax=Gemmata massiliana TaxID=1210884 RepID=A0A6P2D2C1_9BACT|nr:hypothetical protein [Gemmata massiliana]VTR95253.1 unnamed protein product [Gemmata massiliana]